VSLHHLVVWEVSVSTWAWELRLSSSSLVGAPHPRSLEIHPLPRTKHHSESADHRDPPTTRHSNRRLKQLLGRRLQHTAAASVPADLPFRKRNAMAAAGRRHVPMTACADRTRACVTDVVDFA